MNIVWSYEALYALVALEEVSLGERFATEKAAQIIDELVMIGCALTRSRS